MCPYEQHTRTHVHTHVDTHTHTLILNKYLSVVIRAVGLWCIIVVNVLIVLCAI